VKPISGTQVLADVHEKDFLIDQDPAELFTFDQLLP